MRETIPNGEGEKTMECKWITTINYYQSLSTKISACPPNMASTKIWLVLPVVAVLDSKSMAFFGFKKKHCSDYFAKSLRVNFGDNKYEADMACRDNQSADCLWPLCSRKAMTSRRLVDFHTGQASGEYLNISIQVVCGRPVCRERSALKNWEFLVSWKWNLKCHRRFLVNTTLGTTGKAIGMNSPLNVGAGVFSEM